MDSDSSTPEPLPTGEALKVSVRRGTYALAIAQVASPFISVAVLTVLFRLLTPDEFGLVAMVLPLILFLRLFATMGLQVAVMQRQQLSSRELSSLFWLNMLSGVGTAAITLALAPAVAWFYGKQQLVALTAVMGGTAIVFAAGAHHHAMLDRALRVRRVAVGRLIAQAAGGAAGIAAALAGMGAWALVVQHYSELFVLAAWMWHAERWRPGRPRFDRATWEHLHFGGAFTVSHVLLFLAYHVDKIMIGYCCGAAILGLYSQAFHLAMKPVTLVTTPINGVMLPALSRALGDPAAFGQMVRAFYRLTAILLVPAAVGLCVIADPAMAALGGPAWSGAGPMLRAFALGIAAQGFINIGGSVLAAAGRPERLLSGAIMVALGLVQAYAAAWFLGGMLDYDLSKRATAVAWGYSLVLTFVLLVNYTLFALRTVGVRAADVVRATARPLAAALAMGTIVAVTSRLLKQYVEVSHVVHLGVAVATGVVSYLALAWPEVRWLVAQWKARH